MGINRIVMHNGVVWWLPPQRPQRNSRDGEPRPPRPPRRQAPRREPAPPRDDATGSPPGFIPLSSLGIPGIDSLMLSHADFYRDAYERAVDATSAKPADEDRDPSSPGSAPPCLGELAGDGGEAPPSRVDPPGERGPEPGDARRPAA